MTEDQLYDEAFEQMGQAPPEPGENFGPRRRGRQKGAKGIKWKNHTPAVPISIRIPAAIYEWLLVEAINNDTPLRSHINNLLRQAYEAGK